MLQSLVLRNVLVAIAFASSEAAPNYDEVEPLSGVTVLDNSCCRHSIIASAEVLGGSEQCCATKAHVWRSRDGTPIALVIDDLLCEDQLARLDKAARNAAWYPECPKCAVRGNFPGFKGASGEVGPILHQCLERILLDVFGTMFTPDSCFFALISGKFRSISECGVAHIDNDASEHRLAAVFGMTSQHNGTGTDIYEDVDLNFQDDGVPPRAACDLTGMESDYDGELDHCEPPWVQGVQGDLQPRRSGTEWHAEWRAKCLDPGLPASIVFW